MKKIAVVTGASSGIGYSTAKELALNGFTVYGLNRRELNDSLIKFIKTDICDENSVESAIKYIIQVEGRIDVLVNNAGGGISGAVEFTNAIDAKKLFDLNFYGTVNVSKAVIPHMRVQGSGKIINISSVAAIAPIPFQTFYSSTKSAVLTYSLALANELKPFGIIVSAVLPGDIKTEFTSSRIKNEMGDDVYTGRISRSVTKMEKDEINGMLPEKAGKFIASVAMNKRRKPVYVIGALYKCLSLIIKLLPMSIVNIIIGKLYAN